MKTYLKKSEQYLSSPWAGGKTEELAIFPQHCTYLDRNFLWRLSSASIEKEETTFTQLPDYDRVLMVLEGDVVLSYEGKHVSRLKPFEQDRFDGSWKTKSFGKITDYNLMIRKGCDGYLDVLDLTSESQEMESTYPSNHTYKTHCLYCNDGFCIATVSGEEIFLKAGELLVIEGEEKEELTYSVMGEGHTIRAQIFYNNMEGDLFAEDIPKESPSFDDFKCCIYLANTQFRWAKYIVKKLKSQWFDPPLSKAIETVEKFYLTSLVFFLGVILLTYFFSLFHWRELTLILAILLWVVVDSLLVSPLLYMFFVPKPVRKHIKDVDTLTPYEARLRAEELGTNKRVEKLLKKYKYSGKDWEN